MGPNMAKSGAESGAGNGQVHQPGHEPAKRVLLHRVFFGTQGLRAGWSALVFLLIFVALGTGAGKLTRTIVRMDRAQPVAPGSAILREVLQLAALFGATLIMAKIEKRSVFSYGFVDQSRLMRLATGTTAGFAACVLACWIALVKPSVGFRRAGARGTNGMGVCRALGRDVPDRGLFFTKLMDAREEADLIGLLRDKIQWRHRV